MMRGLQQRLWLAGALVAVAMLVVGCAAGAGAGPAKHTAKPKWWFNDTVDVAFVQQYAKVPKPKGVMIIDARPARVKYDRGYIPTAVNIPFRKWDKYAHLLPKDKSTLLIFYCQGPT